MKIILFLATFFVVSFSFAQKQNGAIDTTNMDIFSKELIRKAQNWKQEDEPIKSIMSMTYTICLLVILRQAQIARGFTI